MKKLLVSIVVALTVACYALVPATFVTPAVAAASETACKPARYDFPGAVNPALANGAISKDYRRTIAVLGRQGFGMGCSVTVVCTSVDDSKAAFEAAKPYCKTARDVIASGRPNASAVKALITIRATRPEDGFAAGSLTLILG